MGFEFVSGALFDGRADDDKLTLVTITGDKAIAFAAIEDLIADRLAQYASSNNKASDMVNQARLLKFLAGDDDRDYLIHRINDEGGDPAEIEDV